MANTSAQDCGITFPDGDFYEIEGKPYCGKHYHERKGMLCITCSQPISGRCINALGKRFHPDHFICTHCLKQLTQNAFKAVDAKPYCVTCHAKLFN